NGERSQTLLLFAQGFRAPNLDDLTKFREQGGRIQVPSLGLKPERSHTLEASYTYAKEGLRAGLTLYHTWLNNAIVRRDGTLPDGSAFLVSRGDTLFAQTNVNAESARVYGADLSVSWRFSSTWTLRTEAHYLRGRRRQLAPDGAVLTLPQDHIPPPYGRTSLTYDRGPWTVDLTARYQLAKAREDYAVNTISGTATSGYVFDRTGTSDNLEMTPFLAGEDRFTGTYGWWILNVRAEYQTEGPWAFRVKVDNLLDRHYRTFASGVSAPGVDVGVGLTYRW
ncbi:MAG: TonB-dependent receptor, partial [Bacteroidota bacterium]